MSRSSKGSAAELEVKKHFESQGYIVEKVRNTIWQRGDLFGIADLIAKRKFSTVYVQVKSLGAKTSLNTNTEIRKLQEFAVKYGAPCDKYELWVRRNPRWVGRGEKKKYEQVTFTVDHVNYEGEWSGRETFSRSPGNTQV